MAEAMQGSDIVIRDIDCSSELKPVEALQKEVWGCDDVDVVPHTLFAASREVGATLIGAYDGESLIGFVYGFPGYEHGRIVHHSHMLAVKPSYRHHKLGFKLKLAQRERVLAQGIDRITWTFDPLQSLNAHLNFARLGVIADTYKINFYGETTSSFLHQVGTDRLWVTWLIDSQRVRDRLAAAAHTNRPPGSSHAIVQVSFGGGPTRNTDSGVLGSEHLTLEIPGNINDLQHARPQLAVAWREATRWGFTEAFNSGFVVEDFDVATQDDQRIGIYRLRSQKTV